MRRALFSLVARKSCHQSAIRHLASAAACTERRQRRKNVTTSVDNFFTVPLTLVDVHLKDEQLPFAYFFHETLNATELESSLARVLQSYPILGGKVNLENGVIECHPENSISLSFTESELTLQEWLAEAPPQRLTSGRPAQVLSPLFDCLHDTVSDMDNNLNNNLASIRVTHFDGGGTALGVNLSHVLADAASCVRFVQCWGREIQGLRYPHASNQRSHATCSGMLSPELLDVLDLNGMHKRRHQDEDQWSLSTVLQSMGIEWNDDKPGDEIQDSLEGTDKDSHEYVSLKFSPELLKAMKAHGMAHCNNAGTAFVSTNDVLTAFGWLMKRRLSGQAESNMSMVVNLRGRSDVDNFSHIEDANGSDGVFGNGIASIIATLPSGNEKVELEDMSAAAVTIRSALTEGLSDIPERLLLSRHGRPAGTPSSTIDCFAFTSWQHFPLYDISFSAEGTGLAAFRGYPSHPLPEGDTYNSIIVPEKCGSHTYQLLAPSNKVQEAEEFHNNMCILFLKWYDDHTSKQQQNCK